MEIIFYVAIFVFGLTIGSFLNCVIYRLEHKELSSFMRGRSFCPHCKHTLSWLDLIPVFSFLFLKGKCRYCKRKISWQYPLVELTTGFLFVLILNYELRIMNYEIFDFVNVINLLFLILSSSFLILIFVYDLKHYIIPDKVVYPAILIAFLFRILNLGFVSNFEFRILNLRNLSNPFLSAVFASIFFLVIVLASRGKWMGIGDIKLAFFMGLLLGFPNILAALFFAFLIGAIIGIGLVLLKKKEMKSEVPFGPFLVAGTFIALFWGSEIINWYWNFFSIPLY